jgi:hypothetical protein
MGIVRFLEASQAMLDRCFSLVRVADWLGFDEDEITEILLQLALLVMLLLHGFIATIHSFIVFFGAYKNNHCQQVECSCVFRRII